MTGKDLLTALGDISPEYYDEAENTPISPPAKRRLPKPLLIAALIALTLLLVGCAAVYVLSLQDIKLGERQDTYDAFSPEDLEYLGKQTVTHQLLTFAGLKGTPAFQAAQEWFDFLQSYDPEGTVQRSVWGKEPEFPVEYNSYGLYTQEMKDKLDELLEKYGLKPKGAPVPFRTPKQLLRAMGMENILNPGSNGKIRFHQADYYENGNLDTVFFLTLPNADDAQALEHTFCCLYYRRKDCLIADTAPIGTDVDRQWNYTTRSGDEVLIVRSSGSYVWVFCDTGNCTATLRLESELTDRQVELAADAIDFSLEPKLSAGYEHLDDSALGSGEEKNGYTVSLKSAQTDGCVLWLVLSVSGPEGTDLSQASYGGLSLAILDTKITGHGGSGWMDDGDGLANTRDILLQWRFSTGDDTPPATKDTVLNVYFEDICWNGWNDGEQETLLCEGVWNFDVTFENSDFREIELLSQPVTAKACIGWKADGSDAFEELEVTSLKLRSLSIDLTCEKVGADFFCFTGASSYAVMKDGSRIPFYSSEFPTPIDLDQVDHILLADGTKLPVNLTIENG